MQGFYLEYKNELKKLILFNVKPVKIFDFGRVILFRLLS